MWARMWNSSGKRTWWGGSLFCSLLSRAAGEFQRASKESLVTTTRQAAAAAGPQPCRPERVAWRGCRGAILRLPPTPDEWKLQKRPPQGFFLPGSPNMDAPSPLLSRGRLLPPLETPLSANLIVTQLSTESLSPLCAHSPPIASVPSCE